MRHRSLLLGAVALAATLSCVSCSSGVEGAAVPADGPCVTGAGVTTITAGYAYALAFDDTGLYAATGQGVVRFPLGGGQGTPLTPSGETDALAVAGGSAYFIASHPVGTPDPQGKTPSTTALYAMTLPGGTPQVLKDGAFAMQIASDGARVWWTGSGLTGMPVAGGDPAQLPLDPGTSVASFAVGNDGLYLAARTVRSDYTSAGSILRAAKDGSAVATVVGNLADVPYAVALDADTVYWTTDHAIMSAGLDGSRVKTLLAVQASSLAVDAHAVYFTASSGGPATGAVEKMPKDGGTPETIASGLKSPGEIALHGGNVYWVDGTSRALSDPDPGYAVMTACK